MLHKIQAQSNGQTIGKSNTTRPLCRRRAGKKGSFSLFLPPAQMSDTNERLVRVIITIAVRVFYPIEQKFAR
jgi:hypothetical protein